MTLREKIIQEIMALVRPEPYEMKPTPTIDELERILNSPDPMEIDLRPDGSVYARPPHYVTVGIVADAVLRVVAEHYAPGDAPSDQVSSPAPPPRTPAD